MTMREDNPWPAHDCTILDLDTVTPEPISWLWPGRIPLGMFVLMAIIVFAKPIILVPTLFMSEFVATVVGAPW